MNFSFLEIFKYLRKAIRYVEGKGVEKLCVKCILWLLGLF